ncbi:phospholipase A2 [Streptosporangium sandarakinum]|uniref:phospholipase A2 n=1 Tax=Streptosporangium sandarakinum TaxID=1260955 RepID=UPI00343FD451
MATLMVPGLLASALWVGAQPANADPVPGAKEAVPAGTRSPGESVSAQDAAEAEISEAVSKAKSTGKPVPVPSRTTETSTTVVTPEGRFTTEIAAGPVRVRQTDGTWEKIDTRLVKDGNVLRPKVAKADVEFSAGGEVPFARMSRKAGESLALGWTAKLPEPVVEGNRAIYRGVVGASGDLVVRALPTGLRFDVVLRSRPTEPVEVKIPITAEGLTLGESGGRLKVTDGTGSLVAASSTAAMWDAGSPSHRGGRVAPGPRVGKGRAGAITSRVKDTAGGKVMVLKPDASFLNDPATAYPVTVDPSVLLPLNGDTYVNSAFDSNNVSAEYLKAGTEADGEKARVYLKFDTRGLQPPTNAELKLTNVDAPACGATVGAGIQVRRVTSWLDVTTQTWTPQPTNTTDDAVLSTEGSQLGFCGSGQMTWNVTGIVAKWAAGGTPNHGLVLQSPTETTTTNYRVFSSAENTEEFASPPTLTVTSDIPFTPGEGDDPADPGPADFKPGRVDVDTGVWITSGTDVVEDGLITTRSHSAGQRVDITQPNEAVLGPNWRFEPLGGTLGDRLKDFSANGYIQINLSIGTESQRFQADSARPGTFVSTDGGGTLVKNADGTFTQTGTPAGVDYTWAKVGADHLITSVGNADTGMIAVTYDAQGRVSRMASPTATEGTCTTADTPGCSSVTFRYATATTATSTRLGDITGQLKDISYDAAGDPAPVSVVSYAYDTAKRLREVKNLRQLDGEPITTSSYTYDAAGNITRLVTPEEGTWNLSYGAPGKLTAATEETTTSAMALPARCKYASQYLWGKDGCWAGPVPMSYGGKKLQPYWKRTPGNKAVVGVNDDHCTSSPDKPDNYDFRPACDMHDYGYGIIYLDQGWRKSKKYSVDAVFYTTLRDYTCNAYPAKRRPVCRTYASQYYQFVRKYGGGSMKK